MISPLYLLLAILALVSIYMCYRSESKGEGFECQVPKGTKFTHWSSKWWNPAIKKLPYEDMSFIGSQGQFK